MEENSINQEVEETTAVHQQAEEQSWAEEQPEQVAEAAVSQDEDKKSKKKNKDKKVKSNEPLTEEQKQEKKLKSKKTLVVVTYLIALLCLIAGLFVPLFNCVEGVALMDRLMFKYLPSMFNHMVARDLIPITEGGWFLTYPGLQANVFSFDCLVGIVYTVLTLVALFMFIPVCLGKKTKNTSANIALVIEVIALFVTISFIAYRTYGLVSAEEASLVWTDYNFLIAFGGVLLMAIIHTIASKGGIGVSKTIALVLSAIGIIALLDITMFVPQLTDALTSLAVTIKAGDSVGFLLGLAESKFGMGIDGLYILVTITKLSNSIFSSGILNIIAYLLLMIVPVLTVFNMVCDIIGIATGKKLKLQKYWEDEQGKKHKLPKEEREWIACSNAGENTFDLIRYILTFLFTVALIAFTFLIKDMTAGIYLYLLAVVLLIQIINVSIRTAVANARAKKEAQKAKRNPYNGVIDIYDPDFMEAEEQVVYEEEEEPAPAPVYTAPLAEPLSAPMDAPETYEEPLASYDDVSDTFIKTLSDNERAEFVEVFIKKSMGVVKGVPSYQVDGDNSDFFPAVFVHINRYRNVVSDALMSKMYRQLGKA